MTLHVAFFALGIAMVLIGPLIPILEETLGLNDQQVANFFPVQIAGSLSGTAATWWILKKYSHLHASLIGALIVALGLIMIGVEDYYSVITGLYLNGIGIGLTLPSINMLIIEQTASSPASALNRLNFFWGLGAILCLPMVNALKSGNNIFLPCFVLASAFLFSAVAQVPYLRMEESRTAETNIDDGTNTWQLPIAWLLAMFNFIHIGFETSMGGWLPKFEKDLGITTFLSPLVGFYIFFVAGRLLSGLISIKDENKAILTGLMIIIAGLCTQFYSVDLQSANLLLIGASISGLGTSWIFPASIARFSRMLGDASTRNVTPFFMIGTAGAAVVPWLIGRASGWTGDGLRSGIQILIGSVFLLIVMQVLINRWKSNP